MPNECDFSYFGTAIPLLPEIKELNYATDNYINDMQTFRGVS